jgi:hypothetical protein
MPHNKIRRVRMKVERSEWNFSYTCRSMKGFQRHINANYEEHR